MTDRLPEPTDVGPIAGGNLRASDADRDQVATLLTTAYAEGRLSKDEHDERLDQLLQAKTFDDLIPLTSDLVVVAPTAPRRPRPRASPSTPPSTTDETDRHIAIFGGVTRKGDWRVRRKTQSLALFGGMDLDMREAVFEAPVVEITGFWCFGGLDIKVPEGMQVRDQTAGIFGGTDVRDLGEPIPGAPTLVIKGVTLFGGVSVHGPKPDEARQGEPEERLLMNPGQLRVSDADRDQVTEVLHAAYAEGRISLDEHAERTSAALEAKTFDDLTVLTADLVPAAAPTTGRTCPWSRTPASRSGSPRCWPRATGRAR